MKTFDIEAELTRARAIVYGDYADLNVDDEVVVVNEAGTEYNAVVETRITGGAVVKVTGEKV